MKLNPDGTNSYEFIGWISIAAFIITNIALFCVNSAWYIAAVITLCSLIAYNVFSE